MQESSLQALNYPNKSGVKGKKLNMLYKTILDILELRAGGARQPPYLLCGNETEITARELWATVELMAQALPRIPKSKSPRAMLFTGRNLAGIASFFAAWRRGYLIAPVDPFASGPFIDSCYQQLKPNLCLIDDGLPNAGSIASRVSQLGCKVSYLKELNATGAAEGYFGDSLNGTDPAICIFTSGSTGAPKGVIHSLTTLTQAAWNQAGAQDLTAADRGVGCLPLSHVHGLVFPILGPLVSGGSAAVFPESFEPYSFADYLKSVDASWFTTIPMHHKSLVESEVCVLHSRVRFARSASAPLDPQLWQDFEKKFGIPLINTLGMTETAGQIFAMPVAGLNSEFLTVGKPFGFDVSIIGGGDIGELMVRGPAMMLGYLSTTSSLDSPLDSGGWLATGDIVRREPNGLYAIIGRTKEIGIFCGINFSLNAIEGVLEEFAGVQGAMCIRNRHPDFDEVVDVLIESAQGYINREFALILLEHARAMAPAKGAVRRLIFVKTLPRTGTGKKQRKQLKDLQPIVLDIFSDNSAKTAKTILANALGMDESTVCKALTAENCPKWDSLAQVEIALSIENSTGRSLTSTEIAHLHSYDGVNEVLNGSAYQAVKKPPVLTEAAGFPRGISEALLRAGYGSTATSLVIASHDFLSEHGCGDPESVVEELISRLPRNGHLVMNAFTWAFCRGEPFDLQTSRGEVGILSEVLRSFPDTIRSANPIYSYVVHGPQANALALDTGTEAWGKGSMTYRLLTDKSTRVFTIGLGGQSNQNGHLLRANAALHAIEQIHGVPYRFHKEFTGLCKFADQWHWHTTSMYCRSEVNQAINDWTPIYRKLEAEGKVFVHKDASLLAYNNRDLLDAGLDILRENASSLIKDNA